MYGWLISVATGMTMGFTETTPVQESFNGRDAAVQRDTMKIAFVAATGVLIIFIIER
jgi:hypothetical protein